MTPTELLSGHSPRFDPVTLFLYLFFGSLCVFWVNLVSINQHAVNLNCDSYTGSPLEGVSPSAVMEQGLNNCFKSFYDVNKPDIMAMVH